jgi:HlyD family secretion protein
VPDPSVDGSIEIEHLDNDLYVGRPALRQAQSTASRFKVVNGGRDSVRVQVKLGRTSVNTVEILQGLSVGDEVLRSDMSRCDSFDRLRVELKLLVSGSVVRCGCIRSVSIGYPIG